MENKIIKTDATDRISELPECIIENILLRLDKPKERVRVSVLSKKLFALTTSLPVLKFCFSDFADEEEWISSRDVRKKFYNYFKYTVFRFCLQQNVKIAHSFKLSTIAVDDNEFYVIDNCIELLLMRGVKVLDIRVKKNWKSTRRLAYGLPNILSSVSTLTSLKMYERVTLPSSLMVGVINFKSLKELWLTRVHLDPRVIKHLAASCPLLEELVVEYCDGFKKFCVYGLQNLKTLRFNEYWRNEIETIEIEAPNLYECFLFAGRWSGAKSLILGSCKQLRTLYLNDPFFPTSIGFSDFLSDFPFLENLSLCLVNRHNSLVVSSPSLRNLVVYGNCDLDEININTPNLRLLRLFRHLDSGNCSRGEFNIKSDSGELETCMECHIINEVDTLWLLKLRRFLEKTNRFKFLKLIDLYAKSVDSELLKGIQLPTYELEHVELKLPITHVMSVLDGVLWCFRPRSLSLTSGFSKISDAERSHLLKCISERLIQQEDQGPTNIRIEWSFPSKDKIYCSWTSMLTALPRYEITQTVTFKKEEEGRDIDDGQKWCKKYERRRSKQVQGSLGIRRVMG